MNILFSKKSLEFNLSVIKGPSLNFTVDERFMMEDIHNKFEVAWLENFIVMNRCSNVLLEWMDHILIATLENPAVRQ